MTKKPKLAVVGSSLGEGGGGSKKDGNEVEQHSELLTAFEKETSLKIKDITSIIRTVNDKGDLEIHLASKCSYTDLYAMLGLTKSRVLDLLRYT